MAGLKWLAGVLVRHGRYVLKRAIGQEQVVSKRGLVGIASGGCWLVALLSGCVAGPAALEVSHFRYNRAIQETRKEQLLLNLVRLQYREEPLFLDVGTVAAQFVFRGSGDAGAAIREGPSPNPLVFDMGAGVSVEERPTITFTPLQGKDFANRMLTPLDLDVIALLTRSGWSLDRVWRLTMQNMNGLDNASSASGPTPARSPPYEAFAEVCKLWRELQKQGLLRLGHEARRSDQPFALPIERVSLADVLEAQQRGYDVRTTVTENATEVVVTGTSQVLVWHIPPEARQMAEVRQIVELLGLVPGQSSYEIRLGYAGRSNSSSSAGRHPAIMVTTRSLMGVLFYLSQAVEVPQRHRDQGLVTTTVDAAGESFDWAWVTGDLLRIHSSRMSPGRAAVAVRHRGYWYYVDDADLTSKSTLALLGQLFALQAGTAAGAAPVFTLPVGG